MCFCSSMRKFIQKYYFLGLILSIISLGVQLYNSVLSWYLTSLPKSGYKPQLFVKNDTVLYHMIKYVFLQEYTKKTAKNKVEA